MFINHLKIIAYALFELNSIVNEEEFYQLLNFNYLSYSVVNDLSLVVSSLFIKVRGNIVSFFEILFKSF